MKSNISNMNDDVYVTCLKCSGTGKQDLFVGYDNKCKNCASVVDRLFFIHKDKVKTFHCYDRPCPATEKHSLIPCSKCNETGTVKLNLFNPTGGSFYEI